MQLFLVPLDLARDVEQGVPSVVEAVVNGEPLFSGDPVAIGSYLLASIVTPGEVATQLARLEMGLLKLKEGQAKLEAELKSAAFLVQPETISQASSVIFTIMNGAAPVGCGFFVSPKLAFTASHNVHDKSLSPIVGKTLSGLQISFDIVQDLEEADFMILRARDRDCAQVSFFDITTTPSCASLLGNRNVAVLGCGIAMSQETADPGGGSSRLPVSLTVVQATIAHVGASGNHFGYDATTYDGDSGACLFFSSDNCVVGIHQESVNRAKELLEQEESLGSPLIKARTR